MADLRNAHKNLVRKPQEKRRHGKTKSRWEDNIKMGFKKTGWEGVDWMHLAQDRDQ
jgi:hypothetical protein